MDAEPFEPRPTKTSFVYNTRTGAVVHVHQFIPADPTGKHSDREMEEVAMRLAPTRWDRADLAVLHDHEQRALSPEHTYRVDVENRRLVIEPASSDPPWREHEPPATQG
jgi:hypothetical protein